MLLCMLLVLSSPHAAFGADRTTPYFNVDIVVNENNSYEYTETIGTVFHTPGHGIFRYIPFYWDDIRETVDGGWCSTHELSDSYNDYFYILQMGSSDTTIAGEQEFVFGYKLTMRDDRNTEGDLLYIDLLPTDWATPIESSAITVHMPKSVEGFPMQVYYGYYGSEDNTGEAYWSYDDETLTFTIDGVNLPKGYGLTLWVELPEGYWVDQYDAHNFLTASYALAIATAGICLILWYTYGRDRRIIPTVEFYPPDGMTPAELGLYIDGNIDRRDLVAMFLYYADKGYMKITPVDETKKYRKDFKLTKLKGIGDSEPLFAKTLFHGIFASRNSIYLSGLSYSFASAYDNAKEQLRKQIQSRTTDSSSLIQFFERIGVVVLFMASAILLSFYELRSDDAAAAAGAMLFMGAHTSWLVNQERNKYIGRSVGSKIKRAFVWGTELLWLCAATYGMGSAAGGGLLPYLIYGISLGVSVLCILYQEKYTDETAGYMGRILGLRHFIETAELDRINMLVEQDPEYYYNILPYAYVMGLTSKWARHFERIPTGMPSWYDGADLSELYSMNVIHQSFANQLVRSIDRSVTVAVPHVSSSSSDFGGGFSGGGSSGSSSGGYSGGGAGGGGGSFW